MKPIIGVLLRPEKSYEGYEVMCIYNKVSMAVIKNGGIPIGIYPPTTETYQDKNIKTTNKLNLEELEDLKRMIDFCDGIICQGGDDYYDYDIKTINHAYETNKPLLGICLGMQAMGVAFNGKLQEIASLSHSKKSADYAHEVEINESSKLFNIVKTNKINVNSRHKYKVVTTDLDIAGISDDGIIEVIEDKTMDMVGGTPGGYKDAILVKYDTSNGNIIDKKIFGGSNSDIFLSVIKTKNNNYVAVGSTFSNDENLKNFNKGHGDAILVSYDSNFNLIKNFREPVVLIDKLKTIVPNYGTAISSKYDNIYTSNNPEVDLGSWCTPAEFNPVNANYTYGACLSSFNSDDHKVLNKIDNSSSGANIVLGENEYVFANLADHATNWHKIYFSFATSTINIEISNLKLKFADGYSNSINGAVNDNYLEPLVIAANARESQSFPNVFNLIQTNKSSGVANYPLAYILFKPKKSVVTSIVYTSSRNVVNPHDGMTILELRNFDMSITPTN